MFGNYAESRVPEKGNACDPRSASPKALIEASLIEGKKARTGRELVGRVIPGSVPRMINEIDRRRAELSTDEKRCSGVHEKRGRQASDN